MDHMVDNAPTRFLRMRWLFFRCIYQTIRLQTSPYSRLCWTIVHILIGNSIECEGFKKQLGRFQTIVSLFLSLSHLSKLSIPLQMKIADLLNPIENDKDTPPAEKSTEPFLCDPINFCSICQRSFGRYSEFKRHILTLHPTSETQWHVCPNPGCGKRFTRADALRDHLKTKKAKLYNCQSVRFLKTKLKTPANDIYSNICKRDINA